MDRRLHFSLLKKNLLKKKKKDYFFYFSSHFFCSNIPLRIAQKSNKLFRKLQISYLQQDLSWAAREKDWFVSLFRDSTMVLSNLIQNSESNFEGPLWTAVSLYHISVVCLESCSVFKVHSDETTYPKIHIEEAGKKSPWLHVSFLLDSMFQNIIIVSNRSALSQK